MTERDDIQAQVRKIKRDRKVGWILSPLMIGFFVFTTWLNFKKAIAHIATIADASLPDDASPDVIRMHVLNDCIPIIMSFILIAIGLAVIAFVVFKLVVPDRNERLLLALADRIEGKPTSH